MKVKDVMTKNVKSVPEGTNLGDLIKIFVEKNLHSAPVTNKDNHLVGMVSIRDILKVMILKYKTSSSQNLQEGRFEESIFVEDVMSSHVKFAKENEQILEVITDMYVNNIIRFPVVNEGNSITGILSQSDILNSLYKMYKEKGK